MSVPVYTQTAPPLPSLYPRLGRSEFKDMTVAVILLNPPKEALKVHENHTIDGSGTAPTSPVVVPYCVRGVGSETQGKPKHMPPPCGWVKSFLP